jgi:hypothetical protein
VKATDDTGHFKTVKLHSHWDGGLGTFPKTGAGFTPPPDNEIQPAATIALVGNSASNPQIGIGGAFNVDLWAKESEGLARSTAYANLVNHGPDSATYRHNGIVAARQRIAWAGYRLANLLNAIYP